MSDFDPFEEDMKLTHGRYYPPDPVVPRCTCVAPCEAEPAGSVCAFCEDRRGPARTGKKRNPRSGRMANFKVGQGVRVIATGSVNYGREGSIAGPMSRVFGLWDVKTDRRHARGCDAYPVLFPGHPPPWSDNWYYLPEDLAPLTDPGIWAADAVRKVTKPQHVEPVAPVREYAASGEREI